MSNIYHAHFYFDQSSLKIARAIYENAKALERTKLGTFHERSVGPHIKWSFMILFYEENYNEISNWVKSSHSNLSVLIHPDTGDDYKDHTENALWLGDKVELNLDSFLKDKT